MITLLVLAMIIVILAGIIVLAASAFGAGVILIFGDVIVCIALLVLLMKFIAKRKRK